MKTDLNNLISFSFYLGWREITAIHKLIYGNDYTLQMHFLLELCDSENPIKITEISMGMNLDPSAASTLVNRMRKRGLLRRDQGKTDRRVVFITITEEGMKIKKHLRGKLELFNRIITKGISHADISTLQSIVFKISSNREKQKKKNILKSV